MQSSAQLLKKRNRTEKLFRGLGLSMVFLAFLIVGFLFQSILKNGFTAFVQTQMKLTVQVPQRGTKIPSEGLLMGSLVRSFSFLKTAEDLEALALLTSWGAQKEIKQKLTEISAKSGETFVLWVPMGDEADGFYKAMKGLRNFDDKRLPPLQQKIFKKLVAQQAVRLSFNTFFFTRADSQEPELAGLYGAFLGSIYTLFVAFLMAIPLGAGTGIYLEEFAARGRWSDWIELHLNNLAAVPSIIFGLLGFALFDQFFGLPRPSSLLGGMTLALMICPSLVVIVRIALRAVPLSLRDGALALGASPLQVVFHQVLPVAFPNILTGIMVNLSRSLGESAPLLMVGMVAFIADVPYNLTDPATVLPVQIFSWAKNPEFGFFEKTSGAILGLLFFLMIMNSIALFLRQRLDRPLP